MNISFMFDLIEDMSKEEIMKAMKICDEKRLQEILQLSVCEDRKKVKEILANYKATSIASLPATDNLMGLCEYLNLCHSHRVKLFTFDNSSKYIFNSEEIRNPYFEGRETNNELLEIED